MLEQETRAESGTNWVRVFILFGAACTSSFHIGKVPAALPQLTDELSISLVESSYIVALFSLLIGLVGLMAGILAGRIGYRLAGLIGLVLAGVASIAGATTTNLPELLFWRSLEGMGWVLAAVSIPVLMVGYSSDADRSLVLGIFGAFVPTGGAIALLFAPSVLTLVGWTGLWQLTGLISLFAALTLFLVTKTDHSQPVNRVRLTEIGGIIFRAAPLLMCVTFAVYSALFVAVTSFLPTLLLEMHALTIQWAATLGALVVSGNIVGNVCAGWLLRKGLNRSRLLVFAMLAMGVFATLVFLEWVPIELRIFAAIAFVAAGGLVPGTLLATAPLVVRKPIQVGLINGLILQAAGIGQFIGPPIMTMAVEIGQNWGSAIVFTSVAAAIGLVSAWCFSRVTLAPGTEQNSKKN